MAIEGFVDRFARARAKYGPAVFGLDPSRALLRDWALDDDADGLERFVDIVTEAAVGTVAVAKPQSAFFERHGWRGSRALARLIVDLRGSGVLVLLDVKRGDVGSTNDAYADAYLGAGAAMAVDAMTVSPYLGLGAMRAFFDRAEASGGGLFVVTRSSNPEGRVVQAATTPDGISVEQHLVVELGRENERAAPGDVGPYGAVFAPTHEPPAGFDLRGMGGLFLAPGVGSQGGTLAGVAETFVDCRDRVLPAASRSLLASGPEVTRLRDEVAAFADEARSVLER
jgi:orotidine-5'-phosphate decarboxylase